VALITVIGQVSHHTCGGCDPKAIPSTVSVWLTRSTDVLRIVS
jgi:hypothetical protein